MNPGIKENKRMMMEFDLTQGSHLARKRCLPTRFRDYKLFSDGSNEKMPCFYDENCDTKNLMMKSRRGRIRSFIPTEYNDRLEKTKIMSCTEVKADNNISKVSTGYKCNLCGHIFILRGNAKTHVMTHTDKKSFACEIEGCSKKLRTKESLRRHQLSHLGLKLFSCSECDRKFSCKGTLQEHLSCHTGDKPFNCHVCARKFRQAAVLKRHLTIHSHLKPFECEVCSRKFSMKVYMLSHMKTHTGEKPFTCSICSKMFAFPSDLRRHKIIHSGIKPYHCSLCPKKFNDASSCRRHERKHQMKTVDKVSGLTSPHHKTDIVLEDIRKSATNSRAAELKSAPSETTNSYFLANRIVQDDSSNQLPSAVTEYPQLSQKVQDIHLSNQPSPSVAKHLKLIPETIEANTNSDKTKSQAMDPLKTFLISSDNYIYQPDLSSQEFYNWLSKYTGACKRLVMPLEINVFERISHVHKTLSDFMASPTEVITAKENFKVLLEITKDLYDVMYKHLMYTYKNLS